MRVGVSEMQGYRVNMEDQHTVKLQLSKKHPNLSFFSVFDGHAGDRASIFLSETLHERVGALEKPTDPTQLTDALIKLDQDFLTRYESSRPPPNYIPSFLRTMLTTSSLSDLAITVRTNAHTARRLYL